jgi:pyrroline-5-carboxylate reductase
MASALFGGLIGGGYDPANIVATDTNPACLEQASRLGITTTDDNVRALQGADVVVLAVKPQVLKAVLEPLRPRLQVQRPLLISIAAGINLQNLQRWGGADLPIVRCMPNTPAQVATGATGLYANAHVRPAQRELAQAILGAVGSTLWLDDEQQLDAVTAVSGSGPAYFFLVMEAMQEAAEALGLDPAAAAALTLQTALGAARMAIDSDVSVAELRRRVTSPGGTTEQALLTFEQGGLKQLFREAMANCARRSAALARELGD